MSQAHLSTPAATIRAGVNEKNLFSTLKHLFAGSFSTIGELMQNGRRAGASRIEFEFDPVHASLEVSDDGHGIRDFAALIQLCESDWEEQVTLTDRPYGMGLFSVLFAAKEVTFRSAGKRLTLRLQDVVDKRPIEVVDDAQAPARGTRIELAGLSDKLMDKRYALPSAYNGAHGPLREYRLFQEIYRRSSAFPIPVFLNTVELERPCAQEQLQGEMTSIGFVSVRTIHRTSGHAIGEMYGRHYMNTFLQGLPIGDSSTDHPTTVVHLDGQVFTAQMPDRARLYDAEQAEQQIRSALVQLAQEHLVRQKATLDGRDFVRIHWEDCGRYDMRHLLNDIPWVPRSSLSTIGALTADTEEGIERPFTGGVVEEDPDSKTLISREEVLTGAVRIWRGMPDGPQWSRSAALVLKIAQSGQIASIGEALHPEHWLLKCTPHVDDLDLHVLPINPGASTTMHSGDWVGDINVQLVDAVKVSVFSKVEPAFELHLTFTDDWLLLPHDYETEGFDDTLGFGRGDYSAICYVSGDYSATDHPVDSLSSYRDDSEVYREEWRNQDFEAWVAAVAGLRGDSVAGIVTRGIRNASGRPGLAQLEHMALVRSIRHTSLDGQLRDPTFDIVDLQRDGFWREVAQQLQAAGGGGEQADLAARIRAAFCAVVKPGETIKA